MKDIGQSPLPYTPDLWFGLPHGFIPVDLSPTQERINAVFQQLEKMADEVREQAIRMFRLYTGATALMNAQGVVNCAIGVHPDETGEVIPSILTVAITSISGEHPTAVLAGMLRMGGDRPSGIQIQPMDLLCGPGLMAEVKQRTRAPGHAAEEQGPATEETVWLGTVVIPDAKTSSIVSIQIATASVERSQDYRSLLMGVAQTVSFTDPKAEDRQQTSKNSANRIAPDDVRSVFG